MPEPSSDVVRRRMENQRRRDTKPELLLRSELHRRGLRFFVDHQVKGLKRKRPDVCFTRARVAVFVDGCFWHSCPIHGSTPKSNRSWWEEKLAANVRRDREADATLELLGWLVIRVWEHEDTTDAAERVEEIVRSR